MKKLILSAAAVCFLAACATDPYTGESKVSKTAWGTGIGTLAGAGIGALVGGEKGALVGAGIGAVGCASVGGYMDIQARRLREELVGTGVQVQKVGDNVRLIMPSNITFDTDSAVFKPVFNNILTSVAKVINEFDKTKVQVAGYTDSTGSAAYNNTLSLQRAQAVANYLKLRDVNASRLMVYGYGSSNPIASNATAAGREQNRRVEITLINVR